MKDKGSSKITLSPAHIAGLISITSALILALINSALAYIPLAIYLILCILAPFWTTVGFFLPIISRGISGEKAVAITFDDGPDPLITPRILTLLSKYNVKATFFVIGRNVLKYPDLIKKIISEGHTIGNHSYHHDPFLMLKGSKTLLGEIELTQEILYEHGIVPIAFRPPVGITNPRLGKILPHTGLYCVNFNNRAYDGGNRWIENLSKKILKKLQPDDIILLHDITPKKSSYIEYLLNEIDLILSGIKAKNYKILPLSEIIKRPVMEIRKGRR